MKLFRNKNFIFSLGLFMSTFLLMPSAVKISHELLGHEHFECYAPGELHIHEIELDCDFHKFNLAPQIFTPLTVFLELFAVNSLKKHFSLYTFLSKYQKLNFKLRGPPIAS